MSTKVRSGGRRVLMLDMDASSAGMDWPAIDLDHFQLDLGAWRNMSNNYELAAGYDMIILRLAASPNPAREAVQALRRAGHCVPVLVLSVYMKNSDCVAILDAGADDFIFAGVDQAELHARMDAGFRKASYAFGRGSAVGWEAPTAAERRGIGLDIVAHLTLRESIVLQSLAQRAGRWVAKAELEGAVCGGRVVQSNIVESAIYSLRRKIGADKVSCVRHMGYRLNVAHQDAVG